MAFLVIALLCMSNYVVHSDMPEEDKVAYGIVVAVIIVLKVLTYVF